MVSKRVPAVSSLKLEYLAGGEGGKALRPPAQDSTPLNLEFIAPTKEIGRLSGGAQSLAPFPTCVLPPCEAAPNRFLLGGMLAILALLFFANESLAQRSSAAQTSRTITITSEPNAIVWIDDIRLGVTDRSGNLTLKNVSPARHSLRVRANGFKESTVPLLPGRSSATVKLVRTTDAAELAFQEAETAREQARDDESRQRSVAAYRRALQLRPSFPAARVGLARVLLDLRETRAALSEIEAARRLRPIFPEASAVEGRINREAAFEEEAIKSFRRAIREARGFQPEAHVGLARVLEEKGQFNEAIAEYRKALDQLMDSEPVIYQLLGAAYERQQNYKEAVDAYEKYLNLAPNGSLAPAVRSIIDQLKRDAAGQEIIP
jgi:tetratricopeptide (TPR) repeat protein